MHCRRRRSAASWLPRLWVPIPPGAWMSVSCECSVLSGRGLCDELITRPEESYWLWCVAVCNLETSRMRRPWPALGCSATRKTEGKQRRMSNRSTSRNSMLTSPKCKSVASQPWVNLKNKQGRLTLWMSVGAKELNIFRKDMLCTVYEYNVNYVFICKVLSS